MKAQQGHALCDFSPPVVFWGWLLAPVSEGKQGESWQGFGFGFGFVAGAVIVLQTGDEHLLHSICLEIDHTISLGSPFEN